MIFLLGVACIVDALIRSDKAIPQLLVGAALIGLFPLDELICAAVHPRRSRGERTGF